MACSITRPGCSASARTRAVFTRTTPASPTRNPDSKRTTPLRLAMAARRVSTTLDRGITCSAASASYRSRTAWASIRPASESCTPTPVNLSPRPKASWSLTRSNRTEPSSWLPVRSRMPSTGSTRGSSPRGSRISSPGWRCMSSAASNPNTTPGVSPSSQVPARSASPRAPRRPGTTPLSKVIPSGLSGSRTGWIKVGHAPSTAGSASREDTTPFGIYRSPTPPRSINVAAS